MKKIIMLAVSSLLFSGSVLADTWSFDDKEKIQREASKPFMIEVSEKQPSWTFCDADAKSYVVCYESHSFE